MAHAPGSLTSWAPLCWPLRWPLRWPWGWPWGWPADRRDVAATQLAHKVPGGRVSRHDVLGRPTEQPRIEARRSRGVGLPGIDPTRDTGLISVALAHYASSSLVLVVSALALIGRGLGPPSGRVLPLLPSAERPQVQESPVASAFGFDDGFPEPHLGAHRAVAPAGALGQSELAFKAERAAVATAAIGLFHSPPPRCPSGMGASKNGTIIDCSQSARSKTPLPAGTKCVVPGSTASWDFGRPAKSPITPPPSSPNSSTACSRRMASESPTMSRVGAAIPPMSSAGQEKGSMSSRFILATSVGKSSGLGALLR